MDIEPVYMKYGFDGWEFVSKEKYDKTISDEDRMKLFNADYVAEALEDFKRRAVDACIALTREGNSEQYCMGAMWAADRIRALPLVEEKSE